MRLSNLLLPFARHWIAGAEFQEAIGRARLANNRGMQGIINLLGEDISDDESARLAAEEYMEILRHLASEGIDSTISVKLTQLGLAISRDVCLGNIELIVKQANQLSNFVWIDMEGSKFTDSTLDIYKTLLSRYENVGVCIQANLKRSKEDIERLSAAGGKVRLCKGAYAESADVAYKSSVKVTQNYSDLMKILFEKADNFAIATHHDILIGEAKDLASRHPKNFQFQMLMGIRDSLKSDLKREGYRVAEYIPYGKRWLPYSIRRLRERKSNILLLLRSLISR